MSAEIKLETKLVGSIEGKFYVPSYQRGYRWGKEEVTRLLEDIYVNGAIPVATAEELTNAGADLCVEDYTTVTIERLNALLN